MNKWIGRTLKAIGGLTVGTAALLGGATLLLNTETVQRKLLERATEMLAEKLETKVTIDSASVSVVKGSVGLYGVEIEDRQHRRMLGINRLEASVETAALLRDSVVVKSAAIEGLDALLLNPQDGGEANYQFVIDALKSDKKEKKKGHSLNLNIDKATLDNIHVKYTVKDKPYELTLTHLEGRMSGGDIELNADGIATQWTATLKKGPVNNNASIAHLKGRMSGNTGQIDIDGLHLKTNNGLPRKNSGRPKKGYFDTGHLDITASLRLDIDSFAKDTIAGRLTHCTAIDTITGFDIRDLHTAFTTDMKRIHFTDMVLQQRDTRLSIPQAEMTLPSKKEGRRLSYSTGTIHGTTLLRDIARPFAPVLKNFTLPLNLSARMSGTDSTMAFRDIRVTTEDKKLSIAATGDITNLKDKTKLSVRFNVSKMTAKGDVKRHIIDQFTVKKLMMKQLDKLGTVTYQGRFDVLWKNVVFKGVVGSECGILNVNFGIDGSTKYVTGQASTRDLDLGRVMDMKGFGKVEATAKFKVDISKPRTALMRREKGGKLPIGSVDARVDDCSYKGIHVRNVTATIVSDGAVASGDIKQHGNYRDLSCSFSFTNTEEMNKIKISNPGIKFHKMSEEDKKAKQERKQLKKEEKAKAKALKKAEEEKSPKKKKKFLGIF